MSTINTLLIKRRLPDSILGAGAPASLSGGELAFNEVDSTLYYGASAGILPIAGPGAFVSRTLAQDVSGQKTFIANTIFNNTVSMSSTLDVSSGVNALSYSITGTEVINSSRVGSFTDLNASGDLTVQGDLKVYGASTVIETTVTAASAFTIESSSATPALTVRQYGATDVAVFYDGDNADTALIVKDGGNVGINTPTPNEKLTVVGNISATGDIYADDAFLKGTLGVSAAAVFASSLSAFGAVDFDSTLDVVGRTTLQSTLGVSAAAVFASSVSAAGTVDFDSTLDVVGGVTFASTLSTLGTVDFDSSLDVVGATTLQSTLAVTGGTTFSTSISGIGTSVSLINFIVDGGSF